MSNKKNCPNCNYTLSKDDGTFISPLIKPGAMGICVNCGELIILDENNNFILVPQYIFDELPPKDKIKIMLAKIQLVRMAKNN